jgi:ribosome maturation factor RimP
MITASQLVKLIEGKLKEDNAFLVDLTVGAGNKIHVLIDTMSGVSIEYCIQISRLIEHSFDREVEDFSLEVSSPGLGQVFKVYQQYEKNLGKQVEVLLPDGKKLKGVLESLSPDGFALKTETMVKVEGKKKKELQLTQHLFKFEEVKSVKDIITF